MLLCYYVWMLTLAICITEEIGFTITVKGVASFGYLAPWPVLDVKLSEGKDDV